MKSTPWHFTLHDIRLFIEGRPHSFLCPSINFSLFRYKPRLSLDIVMNVMVLTDVFCKYALAVATRDQKETTVVKVLLDRWVLFFGVPQRLYSDCDRNFESAVISELCKSCKIVKSRTTALNPEGNGQFERFTRSVDELLRPLEVHEKKRWSKYLAELVFVYNSNHHPPFNYRLLPVLPTVLMRG